MKLVTTLATSLCLVLSAWTQPAFPRTPFTDPANLRGERVGPLDGHELPVDQGARGLKQMLRRLNTRASLMLIVAHPDDEDGGMLTLYSRGLGARVATLTLNRGEGGQNAVTGDFEDALGLLRTQELLAADRYFGAGQMFGTEVDFGFSKTKEEAFAKWTHERVLYDAVRAVRIYRPLVVASVFIGGVTDGHGQHQVAGQIAQEVFKAAADPKVFPELTAEGILPWAPLKVYARVPMQAITPQGLFDYATGQYTPARFTNYVTGQVTTTVPSTDVTVHEGQTDSLLTNSAANPNDLHEQSADPNAQLTYVQFARIGLGLQKTQIGAGMRLPPPGAFDVDYHRYGSRLAATQQHAQESSFFDGVDTSLEGIADLAPDDPTLRGSLHGIAALISQATSSYDGGQLPRVAPTLAQAKEQAGQLARAIEQSSLPEEQKQNVLHELKIKIVQLNDAIVLALGITLDATVDPAGKTAGHGELPDRAEVDVHTSLAAAPDVPSSSIRLNSEFWEDQRQQSGDVQTERNATFLESQPLRRTEIMGGWTKDSKLPWTRDLSRPYFTRQNIEQPFYDLLQPVLRNAPATPPALTVWAALEYAGTSIRLGRVVHEGPQPISFIPALSVSLSNHAQVLPLQDASFTLGVSKAPPDADTISQSVGAPPAWKAIPLTGTADVPGRTEFRIEVPRSDRRPVTLAASAKLQNGSVYTEGFRPVGYPGLIYTDFYTPALDRIVPVDLTLPSRRRIGYLPGTGDAVPQALSSVGLKPEVLSVADLTPGKLKAFDAIILGVRTYNAHPDLHGAPTQALLDYARNGGNVIVQYQTGEFTAADAPYPLSLGYSAEKVIDETDPVRLLTPAAALLTTPNRITSADFNDWIEERGHGFLHNWDAHYTALTETHDPGQLPQLGGLITTRLGTGRWTYCAFALYRQLPEAVPGAYRLLINLIDP